MNHFFKILLYITIYRKKNIVFICSKILQTDNTYGKMYKLKCALACRLIKKRDLVEFCEKNCRFFKTAH